MNYYKIIGNFAIGKTSGGYQYLVDIEDLEKVKQYTWSSNGGYLMAWDKQQSKNIYLHRLIMNVHTEVANHKSNIVHHISHIVSDNRKKNLKLVSTQENLRNCKLSKRNASCYTGVSWNCGKKRWQATITVDQKLIMKGMFKNIEDAIAARKAAEIQYYQ